ncbi:hypothetical protein QA639_37365 [Bradyrhizobium pachyrhizi]|uniref:hypothetical protein n=1 Tax=Bradyrhizobium pachyrhizi TaxID=280333 RepID=UPI0024B18C78|nr:hypothetical protein [Bradyrhizobium pachyrhizi]WFU55162.1 hypothetical protein QA639_37365 [Bradyrhizobium pachyrhizi]
MIPIGIERITRRFWRCRSKQYPVGRVGAANTGISVVDINGLIAGSTNGAGNGDDAKGCHFSDLYWLELRNVQWA